jgi:hypothetical protein
MPESDQAPQQPIIDSVPGMDPVPADQLNQGRQVVPIENPGPQTLRNAIGSPHAPVYGANVVGGPVEAGTSETLAEEAGDVGTAVVEAVVGQEPPEVRDAAPVDYGSLVQSDQSETPAAGSGMIEMPAEMQAELAERRAEQEAADNEKAAATQMVEMPADVKAEADRIAAERAAADAAANPGMKEYGGYTNLNSPKAGTVYQPGMPVTGNMLTNPQQGDPQVPYLGPGDPRGPVAPPEAPQAPAAPETPVPQQ